MSIVALASHPTSRTESRLHAGFPEADDPGVAIEHLRRIIEKQPGCLLRADLNGRLLAANDAALGLLGAREAG